MFTVGHGGKLNLTNRKQMFARAARQVGVHRIHKIHTSASGSESEVPLLTLFTSAVIACIYHVGNALRTIQGSSSTDYVSPNLDDDDDDDDE
jgi:hypothetical protein